MTTNLRTALVPLAGATALLITMTSLGGCDEKSQTQMKEKAAQVQEKAGETLEAGKQKAAEMGAQAQKAWDSLKAEYAPQIDTLGNQVASLKEQATKFKDTQLDGYISQLDGKISEIKSKLSASFSADGMQSLKDNMGKWMNDAKALYDKAAARLAELTKGATGG